MVKSDCFWIFSSSPRHGGRTISTDRRNGNAHLPAVHHRWTSACARARVWEKQQPDIVANRRFDNSQNLARHTNVRTKTRSIIIIIIIIIIIRRRHHPDDVFEFRHVTAGATVARVYVYVCWRARQNVIITSVFVALRSIIIIIPVRRDGCVTFIYYVVRSGKKDEDGRTERAGCERVRKSKGTNTNRVRKKNKSTHTRIYYTLDRVRRD